MKADCFSVTVCPASVLCSCVSVSSLCLCHSEAVWILSRRLFVYLSLDVGSLDWFGSCCHEADGSDIFTV